jgi:hypothetical protein
MLKNFTVPLVMIVSWALSDPRNARCPPRAARANTSFMGLLEQRLLKGTSASGQQQIITLSMWCRRRPIASQGRTSMRSTSHVLPLSRSHERKDGDVMDACGGDDEAVPNGILVRKSPGDMEENTRSVEHAPEGNQPQYLGGQDR